ncbi:MAG TPA: exo-beta-N-acetylmuramidase NamZ domain-containing protein [Verrucomicrobiales bacterium]|nr:exo-beta-N-acetylmuramidase NamZ domain-containing protein [Verrucomicrobiales bacterium]
MSCRIASFPILVLAFSTGTALVQPAPAVFRPDVLEAMERRLEEAIAAKHIPGGVIWLEHRAQVWSFVSGSRSVDPELAPAHLDTMYDAASLTKTVATAPSILCLYEDGKVDIEAFAARYLPRLAEYGKGRITVRHLLTHTSGLAPVIPRDEPWQGAEAALEIAFRSPALTEPGAEFRYSDVNFILLGAIVQSVSGLSLDEFARTRIFEPLSMADTGFRPAPALFSRVAPTTREATGLVHGLVHDPVARLMDGVAGHAGLFTTAADLARFCRMMLGHNPGPGPAPLRRESIVLMSTVQTPDSFADRRGLGWDMDSAFSSPRGRYFGPRSYGHTGWTGTSVWIDPETDTFLIILSNRNHPSEKGRTESLRIDLANLAAQALLSFPEGFLPPEPVLAGIDVLAADGFAGLIGKTAGLITNRTGKDRRGNSTIDLFHAAPGVELAALFSPEHGLRGLREEAVPNEIDEATGLPIHSLYGDRNRPAAEDLAGLDALVFDIQDIGCRFYTYISTMGLAMEAAAERGLAFFVLDRPNPIGGLGVEGPMRQGAQSFTAFHDIPLRHGMTPGELARMFREERSLDLDLTVIPLRHWHRAFYLDQTGLPWVDPSPNMRSLAAAVLYPGVGLLEFMNLSVGRGTPTPFELAGAPYVDGDSLSETLNALALPGIRFHPAVFTPESSKFAGQTCRGVRIELTNRAAFRPVPAGVALAAALHRQHRAPLNFPEFRKLLQHSLTYEAVARQAPLPEIEALWNEDAEAFRKRRLPYLLYGH